MFVAARVGNSEAMQSIFPLFFVFLFFSSMAMPRTLIEQDWFRTIADVNPISYLIEGIRRLFIGPDRSPGSWRSRSAICAALTAIFLTGAARALGGRLVDERPASRRRARRDRTRSPPRRRTGALPADRRHPGLAQHAQLLHQPGAGRCRRCIFPLFFFAAFAGGLSRVQNVPGFDYPNGYTTFQFGFVLLQASAFGGVFTGFAIARDFESGFSRRVMLATPNRSAIIVGYAIAAMVRAAIIVALLFVVAPGRRHAGQRQPRRAAAADLCSRVTDQPDGACCSPRASRCASARSRPAR